MKEYITQESLTWCHVGMAKGGQGVVQDKHRTGGSSTQLPVWSKVPHDTVGRATFLLHEI